MATALLLPSPRARAVETPHRCAHWPARLLRRGACCRATQLQGSQRQQAVSDLLNAIEGTDRGVNTTAEQRQQIFQAIGALEALTASEDGAVKQDDSEGVSATWKLLWTTEKETLFILKRAPWFRTAAGDVFQIIDLAAGTLQNVIEFPPDGGAFVVDSEAVDRGGRRVGFNFTGASLRGRGWKYGLPPRGTGWFDNVYVDSEVRVSKDSRGDTLVVRRVGPPRPYGVGG